MSCPGNHFVELGFVTAGVTGLHCLYIDKMITQTKPQASTGVPSKTSSHPLARCCSTWMIALDCRAGVPCLLSQAFCCPTPTCKPETVLVCQIGQSVNMTKHHHVHIETPKSSMLYVLLPVCCTPENDHHDSQDCLQRNIKQPCLVNGRHLHTKSGYRWQVFPEYPFPRRLLLYHRAVSISAQHRPAEHAHPPRAGSTSAASCCAEKETKT